MTRTLASGSLTLCSFPNHNCTFIGLANQIVLRIFALPAETGLFWYFLQFYNRTTMYRKVLGWAWRNKEEPLMDKEGWARLPNSGTDFRVFFEVSYSWIHLKQHV